MRVKLNDGAPRSKAEVSINVSKNGNTLEIGIDGTVAPIVLEYYEGKVRLRVYGNEQSKPIFTTDLDSTPTVDAPAAVAELDAVLSTPPAEHSKPITSHVVVAADATDDELAAFDAA